MVSNVIIINTTKIFYLIVIKILYVPGGFNISDTIHEGGSFEGESSDGGLIEDLL